MHIASEKRYEKMPYRRCGRSGLRLPAVSLGLWQNFGFKGVYARTRYYPDGEDALVMKKELN